MLGLCGWTGQKRAVTSALLVLMAACCFVLFGVRDQEDMVDLFDQEPISRKPPSPARTPDGTLKLTSVTNSALKV